MLRWPVLNDAERANGLETLQSALPAHQQKRKKLFASLLII